MEKAFWITAILLLAIILNSCKPDRIMYDSNGNEYLIEHEIGRFYTVKQLPISKEELGDTINYDNTIDMKEEKCYLTPQQIERVKNGETVITTDPNTNSMIAIGLKREF